MQVSASARHDGGVSITGTDRIVCLRTISGVAICSRNRCESEEIGIGAIGAAAVAVAVAVAAGALAADADADDDAAAASFDESPNARASAAFGRMTVGSVGSCNRCTRMYDHRLARMRGFVSGIMSLSPSNARSAGETVNRCGE